MSGWRAALFVKLINWVDSQIGIRPNIDKDKIAVHKSFRKGAQLWFEFLKRLAVLAALAAASKRSQLIEVLYWISMFAVMLPIVSWGEQFQLDRKTKTPTIRVLHIDGQIDPMLDPSDRTGWQYNLWFTFIGSLMMLYIINFGIQSMVIRVSLDWGNH
jgi:hypothetical protein